MSSCLVESRVQEEVFWRFGDTVTDFFHELFPTGEFEAIVVSKLIGQSAEVSCSDGLSTGGSCAMARVESDGSIKFLYFLNGVIEKSS